MPAHHTHTLKTDRKMEREKEREFNDSHCVRCFQADPGFRTSHWEPLRTACTNPKAEHCPMNERMNKCIIRAKVSVEVASMLTAYPQHSTSGGYSVQAGSSKLTFSKRCKVGRDLRLLRPSSAINWLKYGVSGWRPAEEMVSVSTCRSRQ